MKLRNTALVPPTQNNTSKSTGNCNTTVHCEEGTQTAPKFKFFILLEILKYFHDKYFDREMAKNILSMDVLLSEDTKPFLTKSWLKFYLTKIQFGIVWPSFVSYLKVIKRSITLVAWKINSVWPGNAIQHCRTLPSWVQAMACLLFCAKPLPEQTMTYCWLKSQEETSVKFESKYGNFIQLNSFPNCHLENISHFVKAWIC